MDKRETHNAIQKRFHISNKTRTNLPWTSGRRYSRFNLATLYKDLGFNIGAEIGVRRGRYSEILCRANPNLMLYCIDPWDDYEVKYTIKKQQQIFEYASNKLSKYNTKIIRKKSMDALSDIKDGELDFIFIDGNHNFDYIMMDIILWVKKVKSGGIVSVHDVYHGEIGVMKAVEAYVHCHNIIPWYTTKELEPTAYWVNP